MSENKKFLEKLLKDRYYQPEETCWDDVCRRVALFVSGTDTDKYNRYFDMMSKRLFCPASPIVMSAGTKRPMLSSCFVLPLEDSMESILTTVKDAGVVTCSGGGIGFDFTPIRPENTLINSLGKRAALGPVGVLKMINGLINELKQSGRRKGAAMGSIAVRHPDMLKFIDSKHIDGKISNFNLSVLVDDEFMRAATAELAPGGVKLSQMDLFDRICEHACKTGDPGLLYYNAINNNSPFREKYGIEITTTNTCVVGSVLVAVADGRNHVPIKQLAEEGTDILVHCVDPKTGESHVRMGRNPRLTRKNQDIYKVFFDDGSHIKVTSDHKFLLRDGTEVETKDLSVGASLWAFNKYQSASIVKDKNYWHLMSKDFNAPPNERCGSIPEHVMVLDCFSKKPEGCVCHHKDGDSLNNHINNLEWVSPSEHGKIEYAKRGGMAGSRHSMWGKKHKESTKKLIGTRTKERFGNPVYRERISNIHKAKWQDHEYRLMATNAQVELAEKLYTETRCTYCDKAIRITKHNLDKRTKKNKSGIFCSTKCANGPRATDISKEELISLGHDCIDKTGSLTWNSWRLEYIKHNKSRPSNRIAKRIFGSWKNFTTKAIGLYNHKVVSVEPAGKEDVYNITVDEFHTVGYITDINAKTRKLKNKKLSGVYTRQCSEIPTANRGNCLLGSINLSKYVYFDVRSSGRVFDITNFKKIVHDSLEFLNDCLDRNKLPLKALQDFSDKYRQIGLGCTGFHDLLIKLGIKYGSEESYSLAHLIGRTMKEIADKTRDQYKNITSLTMAPTGSVSLLLETGSFSIEPLLFREMDRHYVDNDGTAHAFKIVHPLWEDRKNLKLADDLFQNSMDIDPMVHLEMVSIFQKYIDNAISKTIMLPAGSTPADVKKIFVEAWKLGLKGITVYVNESKLEQVYSSSEPTKGGKGKTEENKVPETKKRPKFLQGKTYKCRNSNGSFYITLNEHDGTAFEIFSTPNVNMSADSAKSHEAVVNTEALTRVISLCLRSGINPQTISQQLERVRSQSLLSLPIQIANILSAFEAGKPGKPTQKASPIITKQCPSCQEPGLVYDGCWTCIKCGWSKCG